MKLTITERESLAKVILDLKNSTERIVVEGRNDRKALEGLGVDTERIVEVSQKDIENSGLSGRFIDLLDNDRKGRELSARLRKNNIRLDTYFKRRLSRFIRRTEELAGLGL